MYEHGSHQHTMAGAAYDMAAAADTACILTPILPVEIVSFGFIITTALVSATSFVAKLDKRPAAGSDTDRGDGDLGTLTLTAAQIVLAAEVGSVVRSQPDRLETAFAAASPGPTEGAMVVLPGEQAVVQVTTALATSGQGIPFIEYRFLPKSARAGTIEVVVQE
jgi:hypothetical protein